MKELSFDIRIRLKVDGCKSFGPGVAELLTLTDRHSSLSSAAREMGMAYSKAHRIVKECERYLGIKLLSSRAGGKNGGGAQLTPQGKALLEEYEVFCRRVWAAAEREFQDSFSFLKCGDIDRGGSE